MAEQRTENPRVGGSIPPLAMTVFSGVDGMGFYEAEFVKARCKEFSFDFLASIWLGHGNNKPPWLWCSIFAVRGTSIARIERQSQLLFSARKNIGSSEQRNKWKGPVWQLPDGKEAVYAGCDLEPMFLRAAGSVFIG